MDTVDRKGVAMVETESDMVENVLVDVEVEF